MHIKKITIIVFLIVICFSIFIYASNVLVTQEQAVSKPKEEKANKTVRDSVPKSTQLTGNTKLLENINKRDMSVKDTSSIVNKKYADLLGSDDPLKKRILRKEISSLKPSGETLDYLLGKYTLSTDEEKLHIESIITHIDPSADIPKFIREASETIDEGMFVSMVYALRKSNSPKAKEALLTLSEENSLSINNQQGLNAINTILTDTITPNDFGWLGEYISYGGTDIKIRLILNSIQSNPTKTSLPLLYSAQHFAQSNELKEDIANTIDSIENIIIRSPSVN